jgi:hypothetical protein
MNFAREFWRFLVQRRRFYLFVVYAVLLLFGGLIVLTEGSAVAPFVYTLF